MLWSGEVAGRYRVLDDLLTRGARHLCLAIPKHATGRSKNEETNERHIPALGRRNKAQKKKPSEKGLVESFSQ